ncbi:MAG: chemotaxis protein CheX [Desulfobulbaceae bacterium]|nr:chemotaxis protein CheX [Desulfobulbaceae bacterium]
MDLENVLIQATLEVFAAMIFIEITPEKPLEAGAAMEYNLTSLIGLAGDFKGILAIQCPAEVAMGITGAMLGMEVTELGVDAQDAIGEIANMVAGGLKEALTSSGKKTELAIPTTVIGTSIRTSGLSGSSRVMIPFSSPLGQFGVELRYIIT